MERYFESLACVNNRGDGQKRLSIELIMVELGKYRAESSEAEKGWDRVRKTTVYGRINSTLLVCVYGQGGLLKFRRSAS